jgi:putative intracellular protease/amidase
MENIIKPGANYESLATDILMPLPDFDFDPTESAIPWQVLQSHRWKVVFSTETGSAAQGDLTKLKGPLPGLLTASKEARTAYREMVQTPAFQHPVPYKEITADQYAAIILPGGDGPRMRQYLENQVLQEKVLEFRQKHKLVGAICHGILVLARTINPQTGRSILYGHKITALPKLLDRAAFRLDSWFLRRGYIMYPKCVADEVCDCLQSPKDFSKGPGLFTPYAVSDGDLITARWYLDAAVFAENFSEELEQRLRVDRYTA